MNRLTPTTTVADSPAWKTMASRLWIQNTLRASWRRVSIRLTDAARWNAQRPRWLGTATTFGTGTAAHTRGIKSGFSDHPLYFSISQFWVKLAKFLNWRVGELELFLPCWLTENCPLPYPGFSVPRFSLLSQFKKSSDSSLSPDLFLPLSSLEKKIQKFIGQKLRKKFLPVGGKLYIRKNPNQKFSFGARISFW